MEPSRRHTRSVGLLFSGITSEVGRPDQTGIVAQLCGHDASLRAVSTPGQLPLECLARGSQQQVASSADAPTDDEHAWIESRSQIGDTEPQPVADLSEQLTSRRVAVTGGLRDQRAGQVADNAGDTLDRKSTRLNSSH